LENKAALSLLPERLASLAEMDWEERQVNLATGHISYVKILRFYKKIFLIRPLLGEIRFFRLV
jgi:hypothetical protein